MELEFPGFRIVVLLYRKSLGTRINELFPQKTYNFQNLRNETLAIADHLEVKISKLAWFNIKLLLKEGNILPLLNDLN